MEVEIKEKKAQETLEALFSAHQDEFPGPTGTRAKENWRHLPFRSVLVTGSVEKVILIKQAVSDI